MKSTIKSGMIFVAVAVSAFCLSPVLKAETVTEGFDSFNVGYDASWKKVITMPEGWATAGTFSTIEKSTGTYHGTKPAIFVEEPNSTGYIITPMLQGEFSFWLRNSTKNYQAKVKAYECTYENENFVLGDLIGDVTLPKVASPAWTEVKMTSDKATRVALLMERCYFDDFTFSEAMAASGPSLFVSGFTSGSSHDFGGVAVPAGTTYTFQLKNVGAAELTDISISVTGGYEITDGGDLTTLGVEETADLTVATPAANADGKLTIASNDENSPYEILLSSLYKAPAPVMEIDVKTIAFGKVTADATETVTVSNTGDATLEAAISSDTAEFTVDPSSLTVEPGQSGTFTISFVYDSASYGDHSGTVTVTPNAGDAVEIAVTATAKNPDTWEEDFEKGEMPPYWSTTGWTVTRNTGINGNGTYMAYAGLNGEISLTTPRLFANEGEQLRFEVGPGTDNTDKMTVEYSHDLNTWEPMEGSPLNSAGVKTFTAPAEGYYYLRFVGKYGAVDNFEGFRLALKEHDLSIVSENIPAEGYQYASYTASITVREMMDRDETVSGSLYVNGEVVATLEDIAVEANGEKTLEFVFIPEEAMESVPVRIELNYGDETLVSATKTLTVMPAFVFDEEEEADLETGVVPSAVFKYTAVEGWNVISTPFLLTDEILTKVFGEGYEVYEFKEMSDGDMVFKAPSNGMVAGYPYLVRAMEVPGDNDGVTLENVRIEAINPGCDIYGNVEFHALYSPLESDGQTRTYAIGTDNLSLQGDQPVAAYHGYVVLPESLGRMPKVIVHTSEGVVTGVMNIVEESNSVSGLYRLDGVMVKGRPASGIYIKDGKKVVIR